MLKNLFGYKHELSFDDAFYNINKYIVNDLDNSKIAF